MTRAGQALARKQAAPKFDTKAAWGASQRWRGMKEGERATCMDDAYNAMKKDNLTWYV